MRSLWGLLALAGLWGPAAFAQTPTPEPLRLAQQLYAQGRFPESLKRADRLLREPNLPDEAAAQALLLRAKCLFALRTLAQVDEALTEALSHDPLAILNAEEDPPGLVSRLDALRGQLKGTLRVDVEPSSAQVQMDGQLLQAPASPRQVSIGRHSLEVRRGPGLPALTREVVVRAGRDAEVNILLPPEEPASATASGAESPTRPAAVPSHAPATSSGVQPQRTASASAALPLFAWARTRYDVAGGFSYAVGAGAELKYAFVSLGAVAAARPGAELQLGLQRRDLVGVLGAFVALEGTYFFGQPGLLGGGVTAGASVDATRWLEPFAAVTWSRVQTSTLYRDNYLLVSLGARLRWPN